MLRSTFNTFKLQFTLPLTSVRHLWSTFVSLHAWYSHPFFIAVKMYQLQRRFWSVIFHSTSPHVIHCRVQQQTVGMLSYICLVTSVAAGGKAAGGGYKKLLLPSALWLCSFPTCERSEFCSSLLDSCCLCYNVDPLQAKSSLVYVANEVRYTSPNDICINWRSNTKLVKAANQNSATLGRTLDTIWANFWFRRRFKLSQLVGDKSGAKCLMKWSK
jgi:hypothetical protein